MPNEKNPEAFALRIAEALEQLAGVTKEELTRRGGLARDGDHLVLELLGKAYSISWPDLAVRKPDGGACPDHLRVLFLDYLCQGDGSPPTGKWVGYQELPDGAFYRQAFQGYSGDRLVRELGGDAESFCRAAEAVGGERFEMGDAGYVFQVLPNIPLAIVWWAGDDEFPANATVLFDEIAGRYLPTDGLALLGSMLCSALRKVAG